MVRAHQVVPARLLVGPYQTNPDLAQGNRAVTHDPTCRTVEPCLSSAPLVPFGISPYIRTLKSPGAAEQCGLPRDRPPPADCLFTASRPPEPAQPRGDRTEHAVQRCFDRRVVGLADEIEAWLARRDQRPTEINRQLGMGAARIKPKSLFPTLGMSLQATTAAPATLTAAVRRIL